MYTDTEPSMTVLVSEESASITEIIAVAHGHASVALAGEGRIAERIETSNRHLAEALDAGTAIYGVTTGFGGCCGNRISAEESWKLGEKVRTYHGCGSGSWLSIPEARASMFCRLLCLSRGYSGVTRPLLERFVDLLNRDVVPAIPERGSVGASGDLTPMSYIAATMAGERHAFYRGELLDSADALRRAGLEPYRFQTKECLAIMNGTSVMTGIAATATARADRILDAAILATALSVHGLCGNSAHFHPVIFEAKPFPGQAEVACKLRELLSEEKPVAPSDAPENIQDPYSLRCSPHVIGVLADTMRWTCEWLRIEASGVSDNPLLAPVDGEVLMGGNFYGGHVALAADSLKIALASVADLCDRQIALLVDDHFSRGLPKGLATNGPGARLNHGFKAMQITASAITAEALKSTMPATSFSRSTELHNQDKVSMGTIAARDARNICEMVERVVAIHLMTAAQAAEMRGGLDARPRLAEAVRNLRSVSPAVIDDRPLDDEIEAVVDAVIRRSGEDCYPWIR